MENVILTTRPLQAGEFREVVVPVFNRCAQQVRHFSPPRVELFVPMWERFLSGGVGRAYGCFCSGVAVGFLVGFIVPDLITGELQGIELLWIVDQEYRSQGGGLEMLDQFEAEAKHAGCVGMICGASPLIDLEKMRRLYAWRGYVPHVESFYKKL